MNPVIAIEEFLVMLNNTVFGPLSHGGSSGISQLKSLLRVF